MAGQSVLIVGSEQFQSLESSYGRAFKKLGWKVNFWNPTLARKRFSRGGRLGQFFSTFVHVEPWIRKANLELIELAETLRPNLILVVWTHDVWSGTLAQVSVLLPRTPIYCIYPDTPHNLTSDRIQCLPVFDRVMAVSSAWAEAFERLGARRADYLPLAADPELHSPAQRKGTDPSLAHDVVFIGNWRKEREALLENLTDFDLYLWGSDYWKRRTRPESRLRSCYGGRRLTGAEFAQVCAESRVMLNIIDAVGWPGPNMRTFEQPACRAFSLVTRTPAVTEIFKEGETIECFDSAEEARDKLKFYLGNESARERVADASYRYVIEGGHTYVDRARQLIAWAEEDRTRP